MDPASWNASVVANAPRSGAFLQSWEWGAFQEAAGAAVARVRCGEDGGEALAQVVFRRLPLGLLLAYLPRGPIGERSPSRILELVAVEARKRGAILLRADPVSPERPPGARAAAPTQPRTTLLLDLAKSEEGLLAAMHEKTRYNIRLAAKKGVTVREGGAECEAALWGLLAAAAARDRFRTHPRAYYATMLRALAGDPRDRSRCTARVLLAERDGTPLAGLVFITFGNDAVYLHGGSSDAHRNLMAPHLLQWEAIRRAKAWGYRTYDFWGIAPSGVEDHPLAGVSRFKRGFGGEEVTMPPSWELPLRSAWYTIYALGKWGSRQVVR